MVAQSVRSFRNFTFAESHHEIKAFGGWKLPDSHLVKPNPFGLFAAAFVIPACVSELRVGPLKGESRKIFYHLYLRYAGTLTGILECRPVLLVL